MPPKQTDHHRSAKDLVAMLDFDLDLDKDPICSRPTRSLLDQLRPNSTAATQAAAKTQAEAKQRAAAKKSAPAPKVNPATKAAPATPKTPAATPTRKRNRPSASPLFFSDDNEHHASDSSTPSPPPSKRQLRRRRVQITMDSDDESDTRSQVLDEIIDQRNEGARLGAEQNPPPSGNKPQTSATSTQCKTAKTPAATPTTSTSVRERAAVSLGLVPTSANKKASTTVPSSTTIAGARRRKSPLDLQVEAFAERNRQRARIPGTLYYRLPKVDHHHPKHARTHADVYYDDDPATGRKFLSKDEALGVMMDRLPVPRSLAHADEADKMMFHWFSAGKNNDEVSDQWEVMTGYRAPGIDLLNRYCYLCLSMAQEGERDLIPEFFCQMWPEHAHLQEDPQQYDAALPLIKRVRRKLKNEFIATLWDRVTEEVGKKTGRQLHPVLVREAFERAGVKEVKDLKDLETEDDEEEVEEWEEEEDEGEEEEVEEVEAEAEAEVEEQLVTEGPKEGEKVALGGRRLVHYDSESE